jgi:hypothetical protein
MSHEWTLYVFDSVPMFLVTVIFFTRYPRNMIHKPDDNERAIRLESQATCD